MTLTSTLNTLLQPFVSQGVSPVYVSKSDDGERLYVGVLLPMIDTQTGSAPKHIVVRTVDELRHASAAGEISSALDTCITELPTREPEANRAAMLLCVNTKLRRTKLHVTVQSEERRRTINYTWKTKEDKTELPNNWWDAVLGELDYVRSNARMRPDDIFSG